MEYPEFELGASRCAQCEKVFDEEFITVRDNHMIINFFQFENGQDNMFCDNYCLAEYLSAETIFIKEDE
ncbi:hypothetical protein JHE06_05330 [Carnobacterium sp. CS13]|uniref:hypothetical protein n=1 Tax=Carnobacterium sp. CS13 TaxID=2800128 RepID=UPI001914CFEA|nr:hypothetical protein [Carnobacterium sp. CS13]QQP71193.1 hypothetical protein JHE06_05330 [Carnobacterium sp. CS13]